MNFQSKNWEKQTAFCASRSGVSIGEWLVVSSDCSYSYQYLCWCS
jgi:hypothetical protein